MITRSKFQKTNHFIKSASAEPDFELNSTNLHPSSNQFTFLTTNSGYISLFKKMNYTFKNVENNISFEKITPL